MSTASAPICLREVDKGFTFFSGVLLLLQEFEPRIFQPKNYSLYVLRYSGSIIIFFIILKLRFL